MQPILAACLTCLQEGKVSKENKDGYFVSRTLRTLALSPRAKTADRFLRASLLREKMPEMRESSTPMRSFLVVMSSCSFSSSPMYVRKYALSTCSGESPTQEHCTQHARALMRLQWGAWLHTDKRVTF